MYFCPLMNRRWRTRHASVLAKDKAQKDMKFKAYLARVAAIKRGARPLKQRYPKRRRVLLKDWRITQGSPEQY